MQINFAISLHAPNTELRSKLMPINRAYKLPDLMKAVRYYIDKTGRRVSFEYGLFGGENDSVEHAEELADLIKGNKMSCEFNSSKLCSRTNYVDTKRTNFEFEKTLKNVVLMYDSQGARSDIDAACGQLRAKERKEETR